MRTLYLHLGPAKSGSTYLQTSFELSRDALAAAGVHYPELGGGQEFTGEGDVLFGNHAHAIEEIAASRHGDLLISGESLAVQLRDPAALDLLDRTRRAAGFDRLRCLLVLRDPVDHAVSLYQQAVKRLRFSAGIETYFRGYRWPQSIEALVVDLEEIGAEVTLRHLDVAGASLVQAAEEWLGRPEGTLVPPRSRRINRSLSIDELEAQRSLNLAGRSGERVAEEMVRAAPDLVPDRLVPAEDVQRAMLARVEEAVAALNARLPEPEQLRLATLPPFGQQDRPAAQVVLRDHGLRRVTGFLGRARSGRAVPGVAGSVLAESRRVVPRRLRWEAILLVAWATVWRRRVPMRRWAALLGARAAAQAPVPKPVLLDGVEKQVSRALALATTRVPFTASCLDQAVAGSVLLRRRGLGSTLVIGLGVADVHQSHAWLLGESGRVLVGGLVAEDFVPVTEFRRTAG